MVSKNYSVLLNSHHRLPILMQVLLVWDLRPAGWHSRMFCGFRSLWIMPLACSTLIAPAICCKNTRMVSSLSVPLAECGEGTVTVTSNLILLFARQQFTLLKLKKQVHDNNSDLFTSFHSPRVIFTNISIK